MAKIGLQFGALAPPLDEQLVEQGIAAGVRNLRQLQQDADAVSRLAVRQILTEAEADKARQRIIKRVGKLLSGKEEGNG